MSSNKISPWDFTNSINSTKNDMMADDPSTEKAYVPFIINTSLSYFHDTVENANNMNMNSHLDNKLQYKYLLNSIRPRKRFSKWAKRVDDESLDAVCTFFQYNRERGKEALKLLSSEQVDQIKKTLEGGGVR